MINNVRNTGTIEEGMSFAQPRNGNGIAEMMLLTVHGEAQVQTHAPPWDFNLFGIIFFLERDRRRGLARRIFYFNQLALLSLTVDICERVRAKERIWDGRVERTNEPPGAHSANRAIFRFTSRSQIRLLIIRA